MYYEIEMLRDWEDLGVVFRKGEIFVVRKTKPDGDFYTDCYYLIPKVSCRVTAEI